MPRTCQLLFVPIFLLQTGFFLFVSQHRFIDGDEGFYLLASRLVMQHKAPYLDFFYTQAPLLPYLYAAWFRLTGISWFAARVFAALQTAVLGGLIYQHVCRETGKWIAGLAAVLLFASSSFVFAWYPIVKTFPLAALFLFLAYVIFVRHSQSSSGWWIASAGTLFGLSVDTRSYVVAVAPVFLWWIFRQNRTRRLVRLLWFAGGFTVGIIPSLLLFFASPDAFLFNNLGYHAMRSKAGLIGLWQDKVMVLLATFGGRFTGFQFSVLTLTCVGFLVLRRMKRDAALLAFWIAFALGVVSSLPTPASMQYFCMLVPFLIVAAVCSISDYLAGLQSQGELRIAAALCVVVLIGFVGFGVPTFRHYLFTGENVVGVEDSTDATNWTLPQVAAVSKAIDQLASPGEKVVSFWPGYIFTSQADPYPGFENDFGLVVARKLTREQREKYHVPSSAEIVDEFASHGPRLVVIGNQGPASGGPKYAAAVSVVRTYGYTLVRMVGETSIYERSSTP
ncbi:MAG: glycosyltransferase family 39 protein [Candidatus Korobacteraceae bacterium]